MKKSKFLSRCLTAILTGVTVLFSALSPAQAQEQQEPPTVTEMAATEAERLERLLKLEYWQVFYVDSTLQHDFQALQDEIMALRAAKVSNTSMYVAVQDKWLSRIDSTYNTFFTKEQWAAYLKSGAAKQQKAREKRKEKTKISK